jgi:uncharacterized membrane protein
MSYHYVPQVIPTRRPLVFWLVSTVTVLFLFALIFVAPLSAGSGNGVFAAAIYRAFSILCHQLPERSYFIDGHKLGVCSRCTGLYAGFAFTLLLYPLIRSLRNAAFPARKWLLLGAIPLALDFSVTYFGFWENTHTSRLLTGALLGSVTVFYVMPGIIDLSLRRQGTVGREKPRATFTLASPEIIASAPSDYSAPERRI